ncbi:sodium/hydrogen exchanger 9B2-like [Copidosoma floridanum]|uniref:sodium/hydrogen exchanger 9B2-like n=1 Tax=Copidosoma floridanum TaxID=29053 RepID=UPI0006C96229|nr:sodium/hydrogen exchanger 9B2-like [Copidosoma floridanum]
MSAHRVAQETGNQDANGPPELTEDDLTCCHRCTCCSPKLREILVTDPLTCCHRFTYAQVFWLITITGHLLMGYAILYLYLGDPMLPGNQLFGLFGLIVFAYFLGWSLAHLPYLHLPPVFGMLLAGIILRNCDLYDIREELGGTLASKIRNFATTFVMLRAGLQLTSTALREHPFSVLNLAVVPCTMEMLTVALCCYAILGYPVLWAFLAGSIIACISPVVTINCIVALAERGYGEDKEMASLLFTAASIDDVHIVSVYSICFGFIFTNGKKQEQWWAHLHGGIRDLIIGSFVGATLGLFFVFFPHRSQKYSLLYRVCGLVLGSLMCTSATTKVSITGGGFLATIIMSLIATTGWRVLTVPFDVKPLRKAVHVMWHFMQPVLVGVIGADIDLRNWSPSRFCLHSLCIILGAVVRMVFAYLATHHTRFKVKERIFIALSWLSKGTLQAALAPMVFEQAKTSGNPEDLDLALDMVRMAIISILFLAPLGAIIMMVTGPLLLNKSSMEEYRKHREQSVIRIMSLQPIRRRHNTTR